MSKAQTLAKLQTLLARVHERANEPREASEADARALVPIESVDAVQQPVDLAPQHAEEPKREPSFELNVEVEQPVTLDAPAAEVELPAARVVRNAWIPEVAEPPPMSVMPIPREEPVDDETPPEDPYPAAAIDEAVPTLSALPTELTDRHESDVPELGDADRADPSEPPDNISLVPEPIAEDAFVAEDHLEPEADQGSGAPETLSTEPPEDRPPASSRRPVAPQSETPLEQLAFGADEALPPLHTPPPESGQVPAAPDDEFDGEVTGVRDVSPAPSKLSDLGFDPLPQDLVPQETRALIEASAPVAQFVGQASAPPKSFLALLESTLDL